MTEKKNIFEDLFGDAEDRATISFTNEDTVVISWMLKSVGFGDLTFRKIGSHHDPELEEDIPEFAMDTECMGRDSVKRILCALADTLPIIGENEVAK